jgi:hypothetical protein
MLAVTGFGFVFEIHDRFLQVRRRPAPFVCDGHGPGDGAGEDGSAEGEERRGEERAHEPP